jgi:hypothetical protein
MQMGQFLCQVSILLCQLSFCFYNAEGNGTPHYAVISPLTLMQFCYLIAKLNIT